MYDVIEMYCKEKHLYIKKHKWHIVFMQALQGNVKIKYLFGNVGQDLRENPHLKGTKIARDFNICVRR